VSHDPPIAVEVHCVSVSSLWKARFQIRVIIMLQYWWCSTYALSIVTPCPSAMAALSSCTAVWPHYTIRV